MERVMKIKLMLLFILASAMLYPQANMKEMNDSFIEIAKNIVPKVVSISVKRKIVSSENEFFKFNQPFSPDSPRNAQPALGSGVIIDKRGFIATNYHVVANAVDITITTSGGKKYKGEIVGTDEETDLAVIKFSDGVPADITAIEFADSSKIKTGQIVFAVGNALGLSDTVTMGIVSAMHREGLGLAGYSDLIQTDAAINPGNSGGALVDVHGKLIGINNAIISTSGGYMGVSFAIPSNTVKSITDQIIKNGKVTRGWLGVMLQDIDDDLAEKIEAKDGGVIVADVMKTSPADKAGIETGDIILSVNKTKVKNIYELKRAVSVIKPGESARIMIQRGREKKTIDVAIGKYPDPKKKKEEDYKQGIGINVKDIDEETAYQFRIRDKNGVVVTEVLPGSPAEKAGIMRGDLIKQVENVSINGVSDYEKTINSSLGNSKILVLVKRGNQQQYLVIRMR